MSPRYHMIRPRRRSVPASTKLYGFLALGIFVSYFAIHQTSRFLNNEEAQDIEFDNNPADADELRRVVPQVFPKNEDQPVAQEGESMLEAIARKNKEAKANAKVAREEGNVKDSVDPDHVKALEDFQKRFKGMKELLDNMGISLNKTFPADSSEKSGEKNEVEPEHQEAADIVEDSVEEEMALGEPEKHEEQNSWKFVRPTDIFGDENVGEMGKAVEMPSKLPADMQKLYDDGWKDHEFNQLLSDHISIDRSLPDYRTDYCKEIEANYSKTLPATSVIIIFHNEAWSTLLRSVHSVLNRSPEHLITEIILVDDCSTMEHLGQQLDDYMAQFPKVKVLRSATRDGLIKARIIGTMVAQGPVLTFLDSHIEASPGWLEPLLARIAENSTNVVCPLIDAINDTTFEYEEHKKLTHMRVGGFDWTLTFDWHTLSDSEKERKKDPSEPTRSPTMAGGLFSIDKKYFEKLGMYDPGFDIWGAENLELSFKTWMCGGSLEILPCSRVGHIYRKKSPYSWREGSDTLGNNNQRLAEVWMDDYADFYYARTGPRKYDFGDVSKRIRLRNQLKCQSFKWYLKNVYPELEVPSDAAAYGEFRNLAFGSKKCLDVSSNKEMVIEVHHCHGKGGHQYFELRDGKIKRDRYSIQYDGSEISFKKDRHIESPSLWDFNADTKQLVLKDDGKCLSLTKDFTLTLEKCDKTADNQKWELEHLRTDKL